MHPSYILLLHAKEDDPMRELALPPALSEWLFHKKFWEELGYNCRKAFDQYEEEIIPYGNISSAISLLKSIYSSVNNNAHNNEQFVYGWDESKNALHCSISHEELTKWISRFLGFMEHAMEIQSDVYCQL